MRRPVLTACAALLVLGGCTGEFPAQREKLRAAEDAHDAVRLVASLDAIEAWHARNDTGVVARLAAGRDPASIEAALAETDCRATDELKALWSWRDGGVGPVPFVWYHDFLSTEQALAEYRQLLLDPLVQWDPRYLPIFSFEGEWYAAYCGDGAGKAGPVVHYFLEDEPRIAYVNLTVFLETMAQALQSAAVRWSGDGMVEDIREIHAIHQRLNPGYPFPYHVPDGS